MVKLGASGRFLFEEAKTSRSLRTGATRSWSRSPRAGRGHRIPHSTSVGENWRCIGGPAAISSRAFGFSSSRASFRGWRCGGRCPPLEIWRGAPPVRADRDASKTTVSASLLPRRRIRDTAPRTIAETTATDERGVNPSLASPRRPNVVRCPDAPRSAVYFLTNSASASGASTPPVISTVANGAACATALLVIMIWPIRFSSCSIDAA